MVCACMGGRVRGSCLISCPVSYLISTLIPCLIPYLKSTFCLLLLQVWCLQFTTFERAAPIDSSFHAFKMNYTATHLEISCGFPSQLPPHMRSALNGMFTRLAHIYVHVSSCLIAIVWFAGMLGYEGFSSIAFTNSHGSCHSLAWCTFHN